MRIAPFIAVLLIASAASAQDRPFLFDVLGKPDYRNGWTKLLKDVQPTPDWLAQFARNFDGVAGAMKPMTIDGKAYELYFVCKPHDCAAKKFEVIFEAASKRAYGALGGDGAPPAVFGNPSPAVREALERALKG